MTQITNILTFSTEINDSSPTLSKHGHRLTATSLDNGNMNPDEERGTPQAHGRQPKDISQKEMGSGIDTRRRRPLDLQLSAEQHQIMEQWGQVRRATSVTSSALALSNIKGPLDDLTEYFRIQDVFSQEVHYSLATRRRQERE